MSGSGSTSASALEIGSKSLGVGVQSAHIIATMQLTLSQMTFRECQFCQIIAGQKREDFLYVDEEFVVFRDQAPRAPVHLLIVPKQHIENFLQLDDSKIRNGILELAQKLVFKLGLDESEYTIGFHGGRNQTVNHLHAHLIGNMGTKLVL